MAGPIGKKKIHLVNLFPGVYSQLERWDTQVFSSSTEADPDFFDDDGAGTLEVEAQKFRTAERHRIYLWDGDPYKCLNQPPYVSLLTRTSL